MTNNFDEEYKLHYRKGKRLFSSGNIKQALCELRIAFKINPNESLQIKINKIEALISEQQISTIDFKPDENKILVNEKYYVDEVIFNKLYQYQQEGVLWLFNLFQLKKGCILADDMGLGKTIQMIFYLRELFESEMIKSSIIIMPKSLLINWEREIKQWAPNILVLTYFGNEKDHNLRKIQKRGGILITTYGTVMHSWNELNYDSNFKWSILILDEGHKIKNPSSKTFKTVNALRSDLRIVMTGTAVQNNLKELWALFDFTHQGSLLGTYPTFNREYEKPITDSRKKDSSREDKLYGDRISLSLRNLIKPYFLRRTKEEVMNQINSTKGKLANKTDIAIWIPMTEVQIDFYKRFLESKEIKILLLRTEKRSPLLELNVLKKICDHPRLLSSEQCSTLGLAPATTINDINIDDLISESGKMTFVIQLLKQMMIENCKCLIFSQSKVILTILERLLISMKIVYLRLDGDILQSLKRQEIVDNFNNNLNVKILLLTLQVGGVGLTLTGANRVIIYDLNWNPSIDAQAVDRIYRIGQIKDVIVYRLITCGTVEEKIYRRQIFKDSLNRQTTGINKQDDNTFRYFTQNELFELFTLSNPHVSDTQVHLSEMHEHQRKTNSYLINHIECLKKLNIFGISDHDLLFTKEDERIQIDLEIEEKLTAGIRQAESNVTNEAKLQLNDDEKNLRLLMSQMSINEQKVKIKEKYNNLDLFIPNKSDIKRSVFNQQNRSIFQSQLDKNKSNSETFIDLTSDEVTLAKALNTSEIINKSNRNSFEQIIEDSKLRISNKEIQENNSLDNENEENRESFILDYLKDFKSNSQSIETFSVAEDYNETEIKYDNKSKVFGMRIINSDKDSDNNEIYDETKSEINDSNSDESDHETKQSETEFDSEIDDNSTDNEKTAEDSETEIKYNSKRKAFKMRIINSDEDSDSNEISDEIKSETNDSNSEESDNSTTDLRIPNETKQSEIEPDSEFEDKLTDNEENTEDVHYYGSNRNNNFNESHDKIQQSDDDFVNEFSLNSSQIEPQGVVLESNKDNGQDLSEDGLLPNSFNESQDVLDETASSIYSC